MAVKAEMDHHPLTTIEGMLKGSLKRLGDFFKDPQNFGSMTHDVLRGTSQRYQEALDRCEIQILNAKWMLEHDLAQQQAKRAPKPVESTSAAKRKLEETTDISVEPPESPAKKAKKDNEEDTDHLAMLDDILKDIETADAGEGAQPPPPLTTGPAHGATEKPPPPPEDPSSTVPDKDQPEPTPGDDTKQVPGNQASKPSAPDVSQDPKNATDQNLDVDSMLEGLQDNNELNFDDLDNLDANNSFDMAFSDAQNVGANDTGDAALNSLLPGLESYGNNTDGTANAPGNPTPTTTAPNENALPTTNVFDLPEMGDNATFDDFFGDAMGNGTGESRDEDLLNDDSILELGTFDDNWLMDS